MTFTFIAWYAMLCYDTLCYSVLCYVTLWLCCRFRYVMIWHVALYHAIVYYIICWLMSYNKRHYRLSDCTSFGVQLYYDMPRYPNLCFIVSYHVTVYHMMMQTSPQLHTRVQLDTPPTQHYDRTYSCAILHGTSYTMLWYRVVKCTTT